jgi:transcription antitermination factor NusG
VPIKSEWLVIELSEKGEMATYPEIVEAILTIFGSKVDYFVPIHYEEMGSYVSTNILFEGYVFVRDSEEVRSQINNIRESRMFIGILRHCGNICTVNSKKIGILKRKLNLSLKKKFCPGKCVLITKGVFQNLEGEIISTENDGRVANVRIKCMSREILAPIPTTCIKEVE